MKWLRLTLSACLIVGVAAWSLVKFGSREVARLTQRADQLEAEKRQLREHIQRLGASFRAAQVDVLAQHATEADQTFTRLRWQEVDASGALRPPMQAEIIGKQLYVEGLVIKFDPELVGQGDPDKGRSVVLFRRLFGDQQNPRWGYALLPDMNDPVKGVTDEQPHADLWRRFWQLVDDPEMAKRYAVRIAQCEAPSVNVKPGETWEVTLDAAGGLNLRKVREQAPEAAGDNLSSRADARAGS
jgi:hypothetical protein